MKAALKSLLLLFTSLSTATASTLVYEGFDYASGALGTALGGTGWHTAADGLNQVGWGGFPRGLGAGISAGVAGSRPAIVNPPRSFRRRTMDLFPLKKRSWQRRLSVPVGGISAWPIAFLCKRPPLAISISRPEGNPNTDLQKANQAPSPAAISGFCLPSASLSTLLDDARPGPVLNH